MQNKPKTGKVITDAVEIIKHRYGFTAEDQRILNEIKIEKGIAKQIYDLRMAAKLTQKQLATLIGEDEDVIESLEYADYEGNSYIMLNRIADALNKRVEMRVVAQPARAARKVSPRKAVTGSKVPVKRVRRKVNSSS